MSQVPPVEVVQNAYVEVSFVDATSVTGHMIELYPEHPYLRGIYKEVDERTRTWNGRDLITPFERIGRGLSGHMA